LATKLIIFPKVWIDLKQKTVNQIDVYLSLSSLWDRLRGHLVKIDHLLIYIGENENLFYNTQRT